MANMKYTDSFEFKLLQAVEGMQSKVILRKELKTLGSSRQLSRALSSLVKDGKIVRIGYGIYAKAYKSKYIDIPIPMGGFDSVAFEALEKLNIEWELGSAAQAYNAGKSTQVPARNIIKLKKRFRGNIYYGKSKLYFENQTNAR